MNSTKPYRPRAVPCFGAVLLGFILSFHPAAADVPDLMEARLVAAYGSVTLKTAKGEAEGSVLPYDLILAEGDTIKIGEASTAEIALTNGTLIQLQSNTALRIKTLSNRALRFRLWYGTLLAKVRFDKSDGSQFLIESPSAFAEVRGTELAIEETGSRARIGVLDEGHVAVKARGYRKEVMLHFNQETQVRRGLPPEDAHTLQRFYHYKIPMADMRQRMRGIRKNWNRLTLEQRWHVRDAWVKTHLTPEARRQAELAKHQAEQAKRKAVRNQRKAAAPRRHTPTH